MELDPLWAYDPPTGTWKSPSLSAILLARAEAISGCRAVQLECLGREPRRGETVTLPIAYTMMPQGEVPLTLSIEWHTVKEFGHGTTIHGENEERAKGFEWIDGLVPTLAAVLRTLPFWVLLPHLRRGDDSYHECACGAVFFKSPNTGFTFETTAGVTLGSHGKEYPTHGRTFVLRQSDFVAFYGIGCVPESCNTHATTLREEPGPRT